MTDEARIPIKLELSVPITITPTVKLALENLLRALPTGTVITYTVDGTSPDASDVRQLALLSQPIAARDPRKGWPAT
jgi:hypothetical protein